MLEGQLAQAEEDEANAFVTHVVLIPSVRDAHHSPVFPQPSMEASLPDAVKPYVHLLTNPASFTIGGVRVAASSLDVLMLLGQQVARRVTLRGRRPLFPSPPPHQPHPAHAPPLPHPHAHAVLLRPGSRRSLPRWRPPTRASPSRSSASRASPRTCCSSASGCRSSRCPSMKR